MYRKTKMYKSAGITARKTEKGERLETKIRRMTKNKEPIGADVPLIYTERDSGVHWQHDIRTDKWWIAAGAMDSIEATAIAKGEELAKKAEEEAKKASIDGKDDHPATD